MDSAAPAQPVDPLLHRNRSYRITILINFEIFTFRDFRDASSSILGRQAPLLSSTQPYDRFDIRRIRRF